MNQDKILTIGIPAYNMEELLPRCLDSVVSARNIDKLDIIVVNDGSKDRTLEIAKEYEAKYPQSVKVIDKQNGGWGTAINKTISEAQGKYYKSLDSDDWFITDNLDNLVELLENIEVDMVLTDYNEVKQGAGTEEIVIAGEDLAEISVGDYLRSANYKTPPIHAVTFRTAALRKRKDAVEPKFYADIDYVMCTLKHIDSVKIIHRNIYQYFLGRSGQSVSDEGYNKHFTDFINVTKKLIPIVTETANRGESDSLHIAFKLNTGVLSVNVYRILMMNRFQRKNPESKKMLKAFDKYLKTECPELYGYVGNKKGMGFIPYIKIWRTTGFNIFSVIKK